MEQELPFEVPCIINGLQVNVYSYDPCLLAQIRGPLLGQDGQHRKTTPAS